MSRPLIECPPTQQTKAMVTRAWAKYHEAVQVHGPADEWDRAVIDQCIRAFVKQGRRFSSNDMRPLLPEVRKCLISRRLIEAQKCGWIRWAGVTSSTLKSTHGAHVNVYSPIPGALS